MKILKEKTSTDSRYSVDVSELTQGLVNVDDLNTLSETIINSNLEINDLINSVIDKNKL